MSYINRSDWQAAGVFIGCLLTALVGTGIIGGWNALNAVLMVLFIFIGVLVGGGAIIYFFSEVAGWIYDKTHTR